MNKQGTTDEHEIARAVDASVICPFFMERECADGKTGDCVSCIKNWFKEHDEKVRADAIEEVRTSLNYAYKNSEIKISFDDNIPADFRDFCWNICDGVTKAMVQLTARALDRKEGK